MDKLLKFAMIGSVDDGKSTFLGRLLYETESVFLDQYQSIEKSSHQRGIDFIDLSFLTDGLKAEREQGITIDVAYRYFSTHGCKFIVADCPGHVQYTKNMITGISKSDGAVILIDAYNGITEQTKRHLFLSSLFNVGWIIVVINKMDKVNYRQDVYNKIMAECEEFIAHLELNEVFFAPASALKGDNVVSKSNNFSWYDGNTILDILLNIKSLEDNNKIDFRFPVQLVIKTEDGKRKYAGDFVSGHSFPGKNVLVLPSFEKNIVKQVDIENNTIALENDIDVSRGDMIVHEANLPIVGHNFESLICWFDKEPLRCGQEYIIKHTTKITKASVEDIKYRIDVNTMHSEKIKSLKANDIGRASISTHDSVFFDYYKVNKNTGSFILIDPISYNTCGAGIIKFSQQQSTNLSWDTGSIKRDNWEKKHNHKSSVIWLTGLSGSGKTTISQELEMILFRKGVSVVCLDGDKLRHGLCKDLGFSPEDRKENLRRVSEMAKVLVEYGIIVICSFISPLVSQRKLVADILGKDFKEIYVKCSLEKCIERDVKGLYKKAINNEIPNFTGISAPYEEPENPYLIVDTEQYDLKTCTKQILDIINE